MTSADHYRALAAQCDAKAKQEADWQIRAEWEHMARSYHRLAQQAERNAQTDVTYETPLQRPAVAAPAQQQQQPQQPQAKGEAEIESRPENGR
jgi:hypothetical protein